MITNENKSLYRSEFEHDSCGIGFVANLKGRKCHKIVTDALNMLSRMEHRGGTGFDVKSGDGAGILIQMPHAFFLSKSNTLGFKLPSYGEYGVAMTFFPSDKAIRDECKMVLESAMKKIGLSLLGYRVLPVDNSDLGKSSKKHEPSIQQVFIKKPSTMDLDTFERKLFVFRKYSEKMINESVVNVCDSFSIISCSSKTMNYKGQFITAQVPMYFTDLNDDDFVSSLALVHSRFSTNTFPSWKLAQPFRYIAHNGEINTNRGNINWMKAREALLECENFTSDELEMIFPICDIEASDSANLDMAIEMLVLSGRPLTQVMMMLIPEAWQNDLTMNAEKKAFYEFYSALLEPWDGPASVCFTDGEIVGATLDRNGLRPSRYCVTSDDTLIMASESGAIDIDPSKIVLRGRIEPGKMFVADLKQGRIISDEEIKTDICSRKPYSKWVKDNMAYLENFPKATEVQVQPNSKILFRNQQIFGFSHEDIEEIITTMATKGSEPLGSMGADNPLAVLSDQPQQISNYFKQLFAQVTNPPIDSIREKIIMDLRTYTGGFKNLLSETPEHCTRIAIKQPVLDNEELGKIRYMDYRHFQTKTIEVVFPANGKPGVLEKTLDRICSYAEDAIEEGYSTLLLSDRGVDKDHAAIPSLLVVAAVHHHLIREGKRGMADIIVEAGDIREVHHFATILGFGASAINPYVTFETIVDLHSQGLLGNITIEKAIANYKTAIGNGLLKIFAKMGISTLASYQGAQIFEILGISKKVVDKYFVGCVSRIEGLSLDNIADGVLKMHRIGFPSRAGASKVLKPGGLYHWRKDGERHLFNPTTIRLLQESTRESDYIKFKEYCDAVDEQSSAAYTLRGLMNFKSDRESISIDEVESAENILKRFATGAMSFGSISWEAHTTLAIAMNRIGAKSNSGEGGEDPSRYTLLENGDNMCSATKQVASGRFGVNSYYLSNARELQIKMAQGAKPGEGGHLPGAKVFGLISRTRNATPGVGLISPPPHHDIYSIEDLAQLIFDLKNANRSARINVKLVSETGVGTIAAGVCKAKADAVLISGYDGGTGASPISSIKHAGLPWELGLAETHQTLVKNKLRNRIVVQSDGQMKTSKDLAIATLLGAEEWGLSTAALIVEGCMMMRKCHSNTCPFGIATQNASLRAKFKGNPDHVVTYFKYMVQGLREIMAELGFRTINEMVGQVQCVELKKDLKIEQYKSLDFSPILYKAEAYGDQTLYCSEKQNHLIKDILDRKLIEVAKPALEKAEKVKASFEIHNTDRSVGTMLSNEISKKYKGEGLPDGTIHIKLKGSAGQSFGAFMAKGIELELEGDSNDYFGKGLSGGHLSVYPDATSSLVAEENIIIGNVAFYGATNGEAYVRGLAGERFCVRNSGAKVVVEGIGDHGCEYMTAGKVVVLGKIGKNFGAGMSGGIAYVYDEDKTFASKCNMGMIELEALETEKEIAEVKLMITKHFEKTKSTVAEKILADWNPSKFVKVMPTDYKKILSFAEQARLTGKYKTDDDILDAAYDLYMESL